MLEFTNNGRNAGICSKAMDFGIRLLLFFLINIFDTILVNINKCSACLQRYNQIDCVACETQ